MINVAEYQKRRETLANNLPKNSIAIFFGNNESIRNGDVHYRFRQNSDFYYLTGFNEPDAALVILSDECMCILFNRPNNELEEIWNGKRLGQKNVKQVLGINTAFVIDKLDEHLEKLIMDKERVYYPVGQNTVIDEKIIKIFAKTNKPSRTSNNASKAIYDIKPIISEMRLIKSTAEIDLIRRAAKISVAAHQRAMKKAKTSTNEYMLESHINYELSRQGCKNVAYEPIVAAGDNACILHYIENNQPINPNDLVLIDAGGEYANYAADITRVFPISGKFTHSQKQIYELVLKAQRAGIAIIKPGCIWDEIQTIIVKTLTQGLVDLGILKGKVDNLIKSGAYKDFYMHSSGHWLGLDVHDSGSYKINGDYRALEPGMVLTVEPGLYISKNALNVDKRWRGIGVRIEDDILVTELGYENLTADLISDVEDIEDFLSE
jgi:Xaa-Pro aminopeptidase